MALCFSAGEYAATVWNVSAHSKYVDIALNESARIVTGCMKPTPVHKMHPLAGIALPNIRRTVADEKERHRQLTDTNHLVFGHEATFPRLKSRKSFI
nr:unnamed protein product [Callosobruchus analis]